MFSRFAIKFFDDLASNIVPISLPFFGEFPYEMLMLMEIRRDAFDLVALLKGTGLAMVLWLRSGIGIRGANGVGVGVSCLLDIFFQMSMPMMKMGSAIAIMAAGEVNDNVQ
jgi:hypothetical protein